MNEGECSTEGKILTVKAEVVVDLRLNEGSCESPATTWLIRGRGCVCAGH